MSSSSMARHLPLAEKARAYLTASTDPFHAVANAVIKLEAAGFVKVFQPPPPPPPAAAAAAAPKQQQAVAAATNAVPVKIQPGGKYYYTVHHSTLVAFTVGQQYTPGNGGFHIIGGHTDSPNLKVKPRSKKGTGAANTVQLGVECYGGGLWHTWFDRDLSISGKVVLRQTKHTNNNDDDDDNETTKTKTTTFSHKLVQLTEPVARVSTLCIHLQSDTERKAFAVNKEDHTAPIVASASAAAAALLEPNKTLEDGAALQINEKDNTTSTATAAAAVEDPWSKGQEPLLLKKIAEKLGVEANEIADWDLSLYDAQGAALGGMNSEFLYSGRLDNLATVFCAVEALTEHANGSTTDANNNLATDSDIAMICCFDHEEVGSASSHGAGAPVLQDAIRRVSAALMGRKCGNGNGEDDGDDTLMVSPERQARTIAKSFCLSIDQAHAIHPNYASKHEANHAPTLNSGIVIKTNSNQRYATNSLTGFFVREIGKRCGVPVQEFVVRNDCPCGSTIGPIISTRTGIRTVDAGMPQLSMHSCREVMGIADLTHGVELFKGFFKHFRSVDESFQDD